MQWRQLMNLFRAIFKSRDRPKNHTGDSIGGGRYFAFGRTWSGKSVTERTALQTTAVYACVRIISETVASLPLHVYEYTDNGKEKVYQYPLYRLLHDIPNPEMNSFIMDICITGYRTFEFDRRPLYEARRESIRRLWRGM